ncbi:MAG TPA: glyoxalase/bleomycin resistance/extradiol dioxygenase family protein [Pyrinomonadaceae bacterium]|jgi:PhnB protein
MFGIKPYLTFTGNCEEAIKFYTEKLGGEILFTQRYGESPMKGMGPDKAIMHATIRIGDSIIMASDNCSTEHPTNIGNNISLAMGSDDVVSAEKMFAEMSDGARVVMPMQETYWAERFGMLVDKFGINWMFNCDKPEADHAKAIGT